MGIDVYMRWEGITPAQQEAQITGFCATAGGVGYLREAYHGGPYVTKFLDQRQVLFPSDDNYFSRSWSS